MKKITQGRFRGERGVRQTGDRKVKNHRDADHVGGQGHLEAVNRANSREH